MYTKRHFYLMYLASHLTGSGARPASCSGDLGDFSTRRKIRRSVQLTTYLHQRQRLGISGAIPLLSLYAFNAWTRPFFQT